MQLDLAPGEVVRRDFEWKQSLTTITGRVVTAEDEAAVRTPVVAIAETGGQNLNQNTRTGR